MKVLSNLFKSTPSPPPFKPTEVKITVFYDKWEYEFGDGFFPSLGSGKKQTELTFQSVERPPSEFRRNSPTTYGWQHIKPDNEMAITGIDDGNVLDELNKHISDPKGTFILGHNHWQQLYPKESKMAGGKRKSRKRKSRKRKSRKRSI